MFFILFFSQYVNASSSVTQHDDSCMVYDGLKIYCGIAHDYVGELQISNTGVAINGSLKNNFELTKEYVLDSVTIYKVKVGRNGYWCFNFQGDPLISRSVDEAPILVGYKKSLMILADSSLRVSTSRANANVKLCNSPNRKLEGEQGEFRLLIGDKEKVIGLAQSISKWLSTSDTIFKKIEDKNSEITKKSSYFFVDITEHNADEMIEMAKKGGFPYILIYSTTWAKTNGSYAINTDNYPHGINGLIDVSKMASQYNIKIGLHTLTALVSKKDPLSNQLTDQGLLKINNKLAEKYGSYLVDLKGPLKYYVADRIAEIMNKTSAGMIYFDGGEASAIAGDADYDIPELQIEVLKRLQGRILVQGSGNVPRLWPYLSRMAMDDYSTLAPIEYLDYYKVKQILPMRVNNYMSAELGWIGLLTETPSSPATTVEDISTYMARALAFNMPFSIETRYAALKTNPYTDRILRILGVVNKKLQSGGMGKSSRNILKQGDWYFVDGESPYFSKLYLKKMHISSEKRLIDFNLKSKKTNQYMLRINNVHNKSSDGLVPLLFNKMASDLTVTEKYINDSNRGQLAKKIGFSGDTLVDLTNARMMSVKYNANLKTVKAESACSVLNLQLQDVNGFFRDYFLDVLPSGENITTIRYDDAPGRMLRDLRPAYSSYAMKSAVHAFDFSKVVGLNVRWMKTCNVGDNIVLKEINMIKTESASLTGVELFVNGKKRLDVPSLFTGEVLDVFPDGLVTICKVRACKKIAKISPVDDKGGIQSVQIKTKGDAVYDAAFGILTSKVDFVDR
ncbi:hypothetical protein FK216_08075 [Moraxellaceae bacterium AER2_44_116]|nr:hypothetical protein [Moraxellaceae bacterium]TQC97704.1 hypothetical protein FK216_08075 [Moraxellaceae bacterium AER2_44_116]